MDRTAVQFDQVPRNRQAQAQSAMTPAVRVFDLSERSEKRLDSFRSNSHARVGDLDYGRAGFALDRNANRPGRWRELGRI